MIILKYAKENHQGYDTIHIKKDGWKFHPLKTSSPSLVAANLAAFFYFKTGFILKFYMKTAKNCPSNFRSKRLYQQEQTKLRGKNSKYILF